MLLAKIVNSVISEAKKGNTHTHTHTKINAQCAVLHTKKLANENVYKKAIVVRIDHQSLRSVTIVLENTNDQPKFSVGQNRYLESANDHLKG